MAEEKEEPKEENEGEEEEKKEEPKTEEKEKKVERKGKRVKRVRRPSKKWMAYETKEGLKRMRRSCPKCGDGVFMAQHSDRVSCGKCSYTEFKRSDKKEAIEEKSSGEVKGQD